MSNMNAVRVFSELGIDAAPDGNTVAGRVSVDALLDAVQFRLMEPADIGLVFKLCELFTVCQMAIMGGVEDVVWA